MRTLLLGMIVLVSSPSSAAELPNYDVEAYCDRIMDMSGGSAMIRNGCIDNEQTAYDDLKVDWPGLTERTAAYCAKIGEAAGGSYMIAKGCVTNEEQASGARRTFQK